MIKNSIRLALTLSLLTVLVGCDAGGSDPSGCGPANCPNGCCDPATGVCQPGTTALACGSGGAFCLSCTGGAQCNVQTRTCGATGSCSPQTCVGGCCNSQGICVQPGNYPTACGIDGLACKTCLSGQQCVNGFCSGGTGACNASTCAAGCCSGDLCLAPPNANQCGIGGAPCRTCPLGNACNTQTGQCEDPLACGSPCVQRNGCCLNNQCQAGTHALACGSGGQVCDTCDATEACTDQRCQPGSTPEPCTPTTCPTGCCDATGRCIIDGAINEQFCGVLGLSCDTCQTWEICNTGSCEPQQTPCTCGTGQCCLDGQCVDGSSHIQCGTNGAACKNCVMQLPPEICTSSYRCGYF